MKKISPSEIKFFIYVIVMVCIFNLFHVMKVVQNGGSYFYFKNVQNFKYCQVCNCPCDISLVALWNSSDVVLTLNCVFILTVSVTSQYFRSHFLSLFERLNMKNCVHSGWGKYGILNPVSIKTYCSSVVQFSEHDICIHTSLVLNILRYRIWGAHSGEDL